MRKYLWSPVLKRISSKAVYAALLAVAAVCAAFSPVEAATGTLTTNHWKNGSTQGYAIHIVVPDSAMAMNSVTVTGPGIAAPVQLDLDANLVNFVSTIDLPARPGVGDAYSVVIDYLDAAVADQTLTLTVSGVVDAFATPGSPSGAIVGTSNPLFSWTAPAPVPASYALALSGMDMEWRSGTIASTSTSKPFNFDSSAGTGVTLTPGVQYNWSILAFDSNQNSSETRGSSFMLGVNFSGKVTDLNGAGVEGVSVYAYDTLGNVQQNVATTGTDGSYLYGGLTSGSYKVAFSKPPAFRVFYSNKLLFAEADLVAVTNGVITPNVNSVVGDWGTVTGKVFTSAGALSGAKVTLYTKSGTLVPNIAPIYTNSDGSYTFNLVPAGDYQVFFSGVAGYLDQWHAQGTFNVAAGVSNPLSDTVMSKITLTGTVTDGSGVGIPDIWIWLYDASGFFPAGFSGVKTAPDGTYAVGGVAAGSYRVQFDSVGKYAKQYYRGKGTLAEAIPVVISTTGTLANINAVLSSGKPVITTYNVAPSSKSLVVPVEVVASEPNGITGYILTENGGTPAPSDSRWVASAPGSYTFTSTGTKTLYVWAKGYTGLVTGASKSIVVDTSGPTIVLSALPNNAVTGNGVLNLAGFATVPYSTATLKINGNSVPVGTDGSFDYPVRLAAGVNTVTLVADSSGLQSTVTRTITYNQAAPALAVSAPADNAATTAATIAVAGTVASGSTVDVIVNGTSQSAAVSGTTFSTDVSLISGMNTIVIVSTDPSNNVNTAKRTVMLLTGAPDLQITGPVEDMAKFSNLITVTGTVSTASDTTVTISAGANTYTPAISSGSFSQNITVLAGVTRIVVTARDTSGMETTVVRNVIVSGKAGDCNYDAKVSISELQSAINMYLLVKAPTLCIDINADNRVSISELQKVISAYLTP